MACLTDDVVEHLRDQVRMMDADLCRRFGADELAAFAGRCVREHENNPAVSYHNAMLLFMGMLIGYSWACEQHPRNLREWLNENFA